MSLRRTRSQTALLSKDATAKKSARTVSPVGPPVKKRKTNKAGGEAAATAVKKAPLSAKLQRLQRVINPLRKVADSDTSLEFPVAPSAPRGQPKIYYGQNAPCPRWRTLLDEQMPSEDLERDLIRTHPGRTIIPGVAPGTHPKAHDHTIGLGRLMWSFDPGPSTVWGNLTGQELYEHAHGLLIEALECEHSRQRLRDAIRNEQYASFVANVEDPLPFAPPLNSYSAAVPLSSIFNRILASTKILETQNQTFSGDDKYERPELKYQPVQVVSNKEKDVPIASIIMMNMKGTLGPVDQQDPSLDPVAVPKGKATKKRLPIRPKATKKAAVKGAKKQTQKGAGAQNIGSEEKLVGITPALHRNTMVPLKAGERAEDGGRIARIAQSVPLNGEPILENMHRARAQQDGQAQQQDTGKDTDKALVQAHAAGSSQAAESSATLGGEPVREIDKILFPPKNPDEATKYLRMCNEIIADPEARRKHYPDVEAFRRIRSWAGALMPEAVESQVKTIFSKAPTANRPFMNMKKPRRNEMWELWKRKTSTC